MFLTKVDIPLSTLNITLEDRIMALGSCFAENIGKKMKDLYFNADINPFGVLYNPVSILNSIELILGDELFVESDLFENRGLWQSFSHSSLFSKPTAEKCLSSINDRLTAASSFFQETDILLVTFGTAWVFENRASGSVVSNCHKLPSNSFVRRRLTVNEIVESWTEMLQKLQIQFPNLKLIFSVSPVRHWKDGAHENNISKSTLLLAVEALKIKFDNVHYFPAYEIQMDELRDYRFYAADMLHPSDVAVDYIWRRFCETYFDSVTKEIQRELEYLVADLSHRPLHPDTFEYKQFLINVEKRKTKLILKYPYLKLY